MVKQAPHFKLALRHQNKILANYKTQLQQQQQLLVIMQAVLPDALKTHASYCVIAHRKILLFTASAAWASQLRFYTTAMLNAILEWRQQAYIETIQIRILTPPPLFSKALRQPNIPSLQIIKLISEARSEKIDPLSQALANLSKTLEKQRTVQ
ncbi:MAG: DUF721 domain-containing protein [Methylococcaceae bacterium]|nr:DUF721 domain-containing protein [Methylococcaceae bacterium]